MRPNPERMRKNIAEATTEDLLDRVTFYQAGMESEALDLIEAELRRRGVTPEQIASHAAQQERQTIPLADGTAAKCSFCHRPAVQQHWGWHRLWGLLPLFPRRNFYCANHRPR